MLPVNLEHEKICRIQENNQSQWAKNGLKVEMSYHFPDKISSIKVKCFTKNECIDFLDAEGEYLEACCADISRIRDIVQDFVRNGYWINSNKLSEMIGLIKSHGFSKEHPFNKIIKVWDKVKDHVELNDCCPSANFNNIKDVLSTISSSACTLNFHLILNDLSKEKGRLQEKAHYMKDLATMLPAIKTLYEKVEELDLGSVEGYAIYKDDEIVMSHSGVAIYKSEKEALDTNKYLIKNNKNYTIKNIIISLKDGIVIKK